MNRYRKALKNYTTQSSAQKILDDIRDIILDFGGTGIIYDYDQLGRVSSLMFKIEIANQTRLINVPLLYEKTRGVLAKQGALRNERYAGGKEWNDAHAYRVTLANIRDWLDAQLAIFSTEMFEFPQIFLPYMVGENGQTLYETLKGNNFLLLNERN